MSGLYNMLFGINPHAGRIVEALGLTFEDFGRFRDAFVAEGEIVVYTRIGGGNRQDYKGVIHRLRGWPLYLRDADDGYDSTYATFYFRKPPLSVFSLGQLGKDIGHWDPGKRWREMQEWIATAPADDPKMARIVEQGRTMFAPLVERMEQAAREGKTVEINVHSLGRDPKKVFGGDE